MKRHTMAGLLLVTSLVACSSPATQEPRTPAPSTPTATGQGSTTTAPAPAPPPKEGECRRLRWHDAVAPTSDTAPRPCARPHTARTYYVGRLDLVEAGHRLAVDAVVVQQQAQDTCTQRLAAHLGATERDLRLSMAQAVWFTPTVADSAAGAAWLRCDVVVVAGPQRLAILPDGKLAGTDAQAMCATTEPGRPKSRRVTCARPHGWRAVTTVDLQGRRLPSPHAIASAMSEPCRSAARLAAEDPLDFNWSEERPTAAQWRAGQRYGICWVPDA